MDDSTQKDGVAQLINVCEHLLARPDLLSDKMYQAQLGDAMKKAEECHELMKAGRWHEWVQHCEFTEVVARVARSLRDANPPQEFARRNYGRLNDVTQRLWLVNAEDCAATMPRGKALTATEANATR